MLIPFLAVGVVGAFALLQLQEDMKRQLSTKGNYSEGDLEAYLQSNKELMINSLWKLNVADIEGTLSHVCQMVRFCRQLKESNHLLWPFFLILLIREVSTL